MSARLLLLIAMLLGIAAAPVKPVLAACAPGAPAACDHCCADSRHHCCAAAVPTAPLTPLASTATGDEAKFVPASALIFLCLSPLPVAERPAVFRAPAVRLAGPPRFARLCIRLV